MVKVWYALSECELAPDTTAKKKINNFKCRNSLIRIRNWDINLWVCIYVYICMCVVQMVVVKGGVSSGGMVGVKHLYGSKPRSGQLQWPMFKVNGGLRWLFISRLLLLCWTPPPQQPQPFSSSSSLILALSTGTCPGKACPLGSVLCRV